MCAYGFFLGFLRAQGVCLEAEHPAERVKRDRVQDYISSLLDLAASSRSERIRGLTVLLPRFFPDFDWEWLLAARRRLDADERRERHTRKQGRVIASHKLLDAALEYLHAALNDTHRTSKARAVAVRDGLMVALLACRPMRISNFASLRIGYHLKAVDGGYHIEIPGGETKRGRPFETPVPDDLELPYELTLKLIGRSCLQVVRMMSFGLVERVILSPP